MRVYVYWNITKGCFSVRRGGLVIAHVNHVILHDVRFLVGAKGRERVLREGVKNVHAGMSGKLGAGYQLNYGLNPVDVKWSGAMSDLAYDILRVGKRVGYNPYVADHFYEQDTKPLVRVDKAIRVYGRVLTDDPGARPAIYAE